MTEMEKDDIQQLLEKYSHLKKYVETVKQKIGNPVFYTVLPFEAKDEEYPNLVYPAKGSVFIHIYKTKDMDEVEYHAIEPELSKSEKETLDNLLKIIVKRAPEKKSVVTDDELREVLRELIDEYNNR
jgi:hypothetical protein